METLFDSAVPMVAIVMGFLLVTCYIVRDSISLLNSPFIIMNSLIFFIV